MDAAEYSWPDHQVGNTQAHMACHWSRCAKRHTSCSFPKHRHMNRPRGLAQCLVECPQWHTQATREFQIRSVIHRKVIALCKRHSVGPRHCDTIQVHANGKVTE